MKQLNFTKAAGGLYICTENPLLLFYNEKMTGAPFTLPDIQGGTGTLIFTSVPVNNPQDTAERLRLLINDPYYINSLNIVWVKTLNNIKDAGELRGLSVRNGILAQRGVVRFRNYIMHLHKGSAIEITSESIIIHPPAGEASPAIFFTNREFKPSGVLSGDVIIDAAHTRPGVIKTGITLDENMLEQIDAGIRLFYNSTDPLKGAGYADSVRFPVFATEESSMQFELLLHPLFIFRNSNEEPETLLRFTSPAPLKSYYKTTLGQNVKLAPYIPEGGTCRAGFVLERKMETITGGKSDAFYWAPWGTYEVKVDNFSSPAIIAGTSGTEFIQGGYNNEPFYITFLSGCPAFLPGFNPDAAADTSADTDVSVVADSRGSTSYARFHGYEAAYFSQPSGQPYYRLEGSEDTSIYLPTPVTNIPVMTPGSIPQQSESVPVLPLNGVAEAEQDTALKLELRMAAPVRRAGMKELQLKNNTGGSDAYNPAFKLNSGKRKSATVTTRGITPGGYISEFSEDMSEWRKLIITQGSDDTGTGVTDYLSMSNIKGTLRNSFFSNRRCTVISNPAVFLQQGAGSSSIDDPKSLKIAGWKFSLDPAIWARYDTILVFKDHPETLEALIGRPAEWTEGEILNNDRSGISSKIKTLAEVAKAGVDAGDENFMEFYYKVWTNPRWNGFIAFNAPVDPTGFPDELSIIAGGVDPSILKAHHIGVSSTSVQEIDGRYEPGRGALFGLVVYDDIKPLNAEDKWAWKVKKIRAQFMNSRLKDFKAEIILGIRELFGENAALVKETAADDDLVNLTGHYEEHDGKGHYVFRSTKIDRFDIESGVIDNVILNRVDFATVSVKRETASCTVNGRFSLSGIMGFKELPNFDIFSYSKLPVDSIALDIVFTTVQNGTVTPRSEISFSIERMGVQPKSAELRPTAIAGNFPAMLQSIRGLPAGGLKPMGLFPVMSPIPQRRKDKEQGYTFNYKIDFNGAGGFSKGTLTIAWWPGGKTAVTYMGLSIPGFKGKFKICDDLVKIGPEKMQFVINKKNNAMVLLFRRIGMQIPFGLTLPFGGSIDAAVFGDPAGRSTGKLGWYAAWNKI